MAKGIWLILIGLIKKVFIADMLQWTFGTILKKSSGPGDFYPHDMWIIVFAMLMMLYADFSAYTDMARGFSLMFGIILPENFRAPFRMHSFTELWKRWHLTFSAWIRDYIFIPLGGSRNGEAKLYRNLIITFLLAGLWHGASLTFAFWGLLMGIFLAIEAFLARRGYPDLPKSLTGRVFRISIVWIVYISTGVFFFAPDWNWAIDSMVRMFDFRVYMTDIHSLTFYTYGQFIIAFVAVVVFQAFEEKPYWFTWLRKYEIWLLPVTAVTILAVMTQIQFQVQDFFYFQF
jgi:D-alanyl-lipoteichoic acid acyltransferase DltB (MBOAT superfamily)